MIDKTKEKFSLVIDFLEDYPDALSGRKKNIDISTEQGKDILYDMFKSDRIKHISLVQPSTIPDEAVSMILKRLKAILMNILKELKKNTSYLCQQRI